MDEAERARRSEEVRKRIEAVNERLDRLFAFRLKPGLSIDERVQELERNMMTLWRAFALLHVQASSSSKDALEQLERMLDEAEQRDG